jgi:Zn-dependent protease
VLLFGEPSVEGIIGILLAVIAGLTIHEYAHNLVAHAMGDPTPAEQGRLTLDPRVHVNWIGVAMFVLIGFGILGQAPIAPGRMRNPRWGHVAAVAAGPMANLLLAAVFGIVFRISWPAIAEHQMEAAFTVLNILVFFNVLLFVLNSIPLFPLDGWHIVGAALPPALGNLWQSSRGRRVSQFVFLGLILLSFVGGRVNILGILITRPVSLIARFLMGL